ncbi:MAG: cyclase family protein [Eubacteriales bacterium]|nr:cyclase family protein [Eubacteriales bacterium]
MNTLEKLQDLLRTAKIIDMTHPLEEGIPHWFTQPGVTTEIGTKYVDDGSYWREIKMCEHSGTHIDAQSHFVEGGESVAQLPLERLMGRGVNIDATHIAGGETVSVSDIQRFEKENGELQKGDLVFFRFGWDKKWKLGEEGRPFMENWPGVSKEASEYLASKEVSAVGTDASALDVLDAGNPSHYVLLNKKIYIIENVNQLEVLPKFFGVIGLPCKIKDGSGSTMRLLALVDSE